jgi:hypothetical protein
LSHDSACAVREISRFSAHRRLEIGISPNGVCKGLDRPSQVVYGLSDVLQGSVSHELSMAEDDEPLRDVQTPDAT